MVTARNRRFVFTMTCRAVTRGSGLCNEFFRTLLGRQDNIDPGRLEDSATADRVRERFPGDWADPRLACYTASALAS